MKYVKSISLFLLILILSFTLSSCTKKVSTSNTKPIIAVSIVPEKTFVKEIAGDLVDVLTLIPPGNSPSNFAPKPQDLAKLSEAKLYFAIGVPTEEANILPKINDVNNDLKIIKLNEEVQKKYSERSFDSNNRDPHIWLSPQRTKIMISKITEELSNLDEKHKSIYEENAKKYLNTLDELDKYIKNKLKNSKDKSFIIYHPSIGYFADDYNLEMIAIEKDGKSVTPKELEKIIDLAKEKNIKIILHQKEIDSKKVQTLAQEIGAEAKEIDPLNPDYIKNLKIIADLLATNLN